MKHLETLFNLLLFPFLFLMRFSLSRNQSEYSYQRRWLHGKHIIFSILIAFIASISTANAAFYNITSDNSDAEEKVIGGNMDRGSSDLEMPYEGSNEQVVGMRFNGVSIPVGATITKANIRFRADEINSGAITLEIYANLANDAVSIGGGDSDLSNRTATSASKLWTPGNWTSIGVYHTTSDFSNVMQEIVNQPGYTGDDVLIMIKRSSGNSTRVADSRDGGSAPKLEVEWIVSTPEYSCPGEDVLNINGATGNAYKAYNTSNVAGNNISRYFKFATAVDGTITIRQKNNRPENGYWNHKLRIGTVACGNTDIHNGNNTSDDSDTFAVTAGTIYYVRVQERNNKNVLNFDISFDFVVSSNNNPPTFTSTAPTTVDDNVNYTYAATTNDTDGDTVTVTATTLPGWLFFDGTTLSGVPGVANVGPHNVVLRADDGNGGIAIQAFTITVTLVSNVAPEFISTPIASIQADTPYNYTVTTSDANGDTVTVTGTDIPTWLSFNGTLLTGTPTTAEIGDHNVTLTADDGNGGVTTQFFVITVTTASLTANNARTFTKVPVAGLANTNIAGDLLVIGNQSLCWLNGTATCQQPPFNGSNNSYFQTNINLDPNATIAGYLNSTSSDLVLNSDDVVLEAWLYWMGRLTTNNTTTRAGANSIRFKTPTTTGYVDLTGDPSKFNWLVAGSTFDYGAAVNVTQYVQQGGTYWVADLQATSKSNQGSGWALAIVVEDTGLPRKRKVKNISLYDGFSGVYSGAGYPNTVSSTISGFLTPTLGSVKSNLIVFAGESDRNLDDTMSLTNSSGTPIALKDSLNDTDNVQNGTISKNGVNVTTRNPNFENTLGIDIDELNVSNIIENNQTSTVITLESGGDKIFLEMYGFATELYVPEVCYDYTVQRNNFDITLDNRTIITNEGNLSITLALQSLEGDFDFTNSQIGVRLVPTSNTSFIEALYAPNNINTFIPGIHTTGSTSFKPMIGIGEDIPVTAGLTNGGIIKANQRYFSQFNYTINDTYNGKFEVDLNTTINFGSGAVPVFQSTQFNDIPRCPQSDYYAPIEGSFNVERVGSSGAANQKFPLYTQIVGKPFDFDVVAYNQSSSPPFSAELPLSGYTVDLELINASTFTDDHSIFICNNPSQSIVKSIDSTGRRNTFARFDTIAGSSRVTMSNIQTDTALRNAALRVWYIVDKNNTILPHNCPDPIDNPGASNTCFQTLYDTYLLNDDNITSVDGSIGFCRPKTGLTNCSAYTNTVKGTSGCYACLRDYFSRAVCSRDNFSVRPVSYRLDIADNNEDSNSSNTGTSLGINDSTTSVATLAAGYQYRLNGHATSYISSATPALGYNRSFTSQSNNIVGSILNFDTDPSLPLKNPIECVDKNNTEWNINFDGGYIQPNLLSNLNVGQYQHHIIDANWTLVDQATFQYKTFPNVDDCTPNTNTVSVTNTGKSGCETDTVISVNGATYTDLQLTFMPYRFDISNVSLQVLDNNTSNYMFMNDFDNAGYTVPVPLPLSMSAAFIGNVVAKAKGASNTTTTNFNDDCHSEKLSLHLDRNISRLISGVRNYIQENTLIEDDVAPVANTANALVFQQYLQEANSSFAPIVTLNKVITSDGNTTIRDTAFSALTPGEAAIRLHTNFKKPLESGVSRLINPIDINYTKLTVSSVDAQSSAEGGTHTPDGNKTYNRKLTALFSRVVSAQSLYDNVVPDFIETTVFVDIYCNDIGITCADYNLTTGTNEQSGTLSWFSASDNNITSSNYYNALNDGDTIFRATVPHGTASPQVYGANPSTSQMFDGPLPALSGTMTDVNVSVPAGTAKPATIDIAIEPDPWHVFYSSDDKGFPHYRVKFIGPSTWSGVGNTGETVEATTSNKSPRMNW